MTEIHLDEYGCEPEMEYGVWGAYLRECVHKFEKSRVFDSLTIYEVEQEIEILYW